MRDGLWTLKSESLIDNDPLTANLSIRSIKANELIVLVTLLIVKFPITFTESSMNSKFDNKEPYSSIRIMTLIRLWFDMNS